MDQRIPELLSGATQRFDTVALTCRAEYDGPLLQRAMERSIPDFEARLREGSVVRFTAAKRRGGAEDDRRSRHDCRAWWRKPAFWRDDIVWGEDGVARNVVRGDIRASSCTAPR